MTEWTDEQLEIFDQTEELEISSPRPDGTLWPFVPIWVVRVEDSVWVRSYRGTAGAWYQHVTGNGRARIRIAGREHDVVAEPPPNRELDQQIDRAYRTKYAPHSEQYVAPMVAEEARSTTLRLTPLRNR